MKRSPMRRSTKPMARRTQIRRYTRINQKRTRARRGKFVDEPYKAFIRQQPCCARHLGPCDNVRRDGLRDPHHAGIWDKTDDDRWCIPLCRRHHNAIERRLAPCDWTREERRAWVAAQVGYYQTIYALVVASASG